jgi:hypothetical protein
MKIVLLLTASALTFAGATFGAATSPAHAETLRKGVPTQGVYWVLEKDSLGKVFYECYDEKTEEKLSSQECSDAKAKKPVRLYRRMDLM